MCWKPSDLIVALLTLVACAPGAATRADVVVTVGATAFGRVAKLTASDVELLDGCAGAHSQSLPWSAVKAVVFDVQCSPYDVVLPTAGLQPPCATSKVLVFQVNVKGQDAPLFGRAVTLARGIAHVELIDDSGTLHCAAGELVQVLPKTMCPSVLPRTFKWPPVFCFEPRQLAVNFSRDAVWNNSIFTKGFSIYLEHDCEGGGAPLPDVREAFQTAITYWTSALFEKRATAGEALRSYLEGIFPKSEKLGMLVPPQVVQVQCVESAQIVLKWYGQRSAAFPLEREYVAKAQLEGRTILVNAADFDFLYSLQRPPFALSARQYDLTTVLLHELGHCFGLPDRDDGDPSVMNASEPADAPMGADGSALMTVLEASVKGSDPGVLHPTLCRGLRPRGSRRTPTISRE
jgi:hypothetical protein